MQDGCWLSKQRSAGLAVMLAVLAIAGLQGCGSRTTPPAATRAEADTLANGLPRVALPVLAEWSARWRESVPTFAPESLVSEESGLTAMQPSGTGTDLRHVADVRERAGIVTLSPDSTHALDFDRYVDIDPESGSLERDVDSSPMLWDYAGDTLWTVAFCGTSCAYDGGAWLDANRFVLTGTTQSGPNYDGPAQPFLDLYDLAGRTTRRWLGAPVTEDALRRFGQACEASLSARVARSLANADSPRTSTRRAAH